MKQPVAPRAQITYTDDQQQQHLENISQHTSLATGQPAAVHQVVPALEQSVDLSEYGLGPSQDIDNDGVPDEIDPFIGPNVENVLSGIQGKPRHTKAINFLKEKLKWMQKKHGKEVTLKK